MKKSIKKFRGLIIFIVIEAYSYFKINPKNLEMFFMIWALISITFLLYNIFNVKYNVAMLGLGDSQDSSIQAMGSYLEEVYAPDKSKKGNGYGILDPTNLVYLAFVIANVIGYILVMPK